MRFTIKRSAGAAGAFEAMVHDLRAVLRQAQAPSPDPSAAVLDARTLQSTPESGARAGYDGAKRRKGSKVHMAVDTLGHLLALHVTPANADDGAEVGRLAQAVQTATGNSVELGYVDHGYTGVKPAEAARAHGMVLDPVNSSPRNLKALCQRGTTCCMIVKSITGSDG